MRRSFLASKWARRSLPALLLMATVGLVAAIATRADLPGNAVSLDQVTRGRLLVVNHDCAGCHTVTATGAEKPTPDEPRFLAGYLPDTPPFEIGPFKTRPRNLTPDNTTGLGRMSARQIFNALRYGLRPGETPDVEITSTTPGQGNFPANPKYLAPPMPWPAWRHMSDQELWDIAAYIKHGIKPVVNKVQDSEGPPDFWAGAYTPDQIGLYPAPVYPASNEEFRP
jgi:mono/diheme cytochrome c family protein